MVYLRKALRNGIVHRNKSMVTCVLCLLIVLLFQTYAAAISSNRKQLNRLAGALPVQGKILNVQGSQETSLDIREPVVRQLQQLPYLYDKLFTARTNAGIGTLAAGETQKALALSVLSANAAAAVPNLSEKEITWAAGNGLSFFEQDEEKCVVVKAKMDQNHWKLGDTVSLTQFYYKYGAGYQVNLNKLATTSFQIVGVAEPAANEGASYDMILPFRTEQGIFQKSGIPFSADSASFYIEPLKLNVFKQAMQKIPLLQVAQTAQFSHAGIALAVNDAAFITAASQLRQGMDILMGFFPFILILMVGIGYIASYLLLQDRKNEIAIMRSIGVSGRGCFGMAVIEQLSVALIGVIAGSALAAVFLSAAFWMLLTGPALVLCCYIAGTCAAMRRAGRVSVMEALTRVD